MEWTWVWAGKLITDQPLLDRRLYFTELDAYAIANWADVDYTDGKISANEHREAYDAVNRRLLYVHSIIRN